LLQNLHLGTYRVTAGRGSPYHSLGLKTVLSICGSLRETSVNRSFCHAAAVLAPAGLTVVEFGEIGLLPLFNPDLEVTPPVSVITFRQAVASSDALLIASPEYAHGITSALKNALDWLVSFEPFSGKVISLVHLSARATHADLSSREILMTMSAVVHVGSSVKIDLGSNALTKEQILGSPEICAKICYALAELLSYLRHKETMPKPS
jgi:chromate reductase, NAD(P)H dehydrogenase (quinone)